MRPISDFLTSPADRLDDPLERGSARLLSVCLLTMIAAFSSLDVGLYLTEPGYTPPWEGYVFLFGSYGLSRTSLYRWGTIATTLMFPAVALSELVVSGGKDIGPLGYAMLAPFFAGLFLGVRGSLTLAVLNPLWIALVPLLAPQVVFYSEILDLLLANVFAGLLAVSYSLRRDWLEKRREENQRLHEKQLIQMQKMEALGRMAGGIAHDFNNLLTVISGGVELLARNGAGKELRLIDQATSSAQQLTSQLLTLSRQGVVEHASTDLQKMFRGMHDLLSRIIGEDIELRVEAKPDTFPVALTEVQLQQILLNLATNARDAMPRGGILEFSAENVGEGEVQLIIRDTGEGMDEVTASKVFEPFFTTKGVGVGTGLGLSMVFGLVNQSGGRIEVNSAPQEGTTFRIRLLRAEMTEEASPLSLSERKLDLRGRAKGRILLVEDDSDVRELCRSVLRREGYDVIEAASPREALEVFQEREGQLDLLLSDVVMPQMTGPELAELLREREPDLPLLFISGYAPEQLAGGGLDARLLLRKPFRPTELLRRVSAILYGLESQSPPPAEEGSAAADVIPAAPRIPTQPSPDFEDDAELVSSPVSSQPVESGERAKGGGEVEMGAKDTRPKVASDE